MTDNEFFKKCLDILLREEFIPGVLLFDCDDLDEFMIVHKECEMHLTEFLHELYYEIIDSLESEV